MKEIITYLNFDGNCREAMEFYKKCLDAELSLMPFSEVPGNVPKDAKDRIRKRPLSERGHSEARWGRCRRIAA